jgi:hypothetical protein
MTTLERETWPDRRPVAVVRGHRTHIGWWWLSDARVNLESDYGEAQAPVVDVRPDKVAADLLARLVEQTGGRRVRATRPDDGVKP